MKYQIEYCPNDAFIVIHVDQQLSQRLECYDHASTEVPPWVSNVLAVPGVTEVYVKPYQLIVLFD